MDEDEHRLEVENDNAVLGSQSKDVPASRRFLVFLISTGVLVAGVLLVGAWGLSRWVNPCANVVLSETISPDSEKKVVVFLRDCGATTGFSTHVSILSIDQEIGNSAGNVLVIGRVDNGIPRNNDRDPEVLAQWLDRSTLRLTYREDARLFQKESNYENFVILHEVMTN